MNTATIERQAPPAGFAAYAPSARAPLGYYELQHKYGRAAFAKACAESKTSPLSVQEILERDSRKQTAPSHGHST